MNQAGRPQCFTQAKSDRIVQAIRNGLPYKLAAAAGGVSYNTFIRWRNQGTKDDAQPHFRQFLNQVRIAEAEAAERLVGIIEERARIHWQAAAWMLERRHPDLFTKDTALLDRPFQEFAITMEDD